MTAAYETELNNNLQWALGEGSMFFEERRGGFMRPSEQSPGGYRS
jgi:hypothetical protein